MFSKFFINRPIFATVLALLIVVAGLVTLNILPVAQFPEITPPPVPAAMIVRYLPCFVPAQLPYRCPYQQRM